MKERERIISLFIGTLCLELELSIRMALKVKWMTVECRMHIGCNQDRIPAGPSDAQCCDYENHNLIFIKSLLILYSLAWLKEENTRRGSGGGERGGCQGTRILGFHWSANKLQKYAMRQFTDQRRPEGERQWRRGKQWERERGSASKETLWAKK